MNGVNGTSRAPDTAAIAKNQSEHVVASSEKLNLPEKVLSRKGLNDRTVRKWGLLEKKRWVRQRVRSASTQKTFDGHKVKRIGDNGKSPRFTFIFTGSGMGMTVGGRNFSGRRARHLSK